MRGFLVGSIGLIALYTLVQPEASGRVAATSSVIVKVAQRLLSPTVAGLPDFSVPRVGKSPYEPSTPAPPAGRVIGDATGWILSR